MTQGMWSEVVYTTLQYVTGTEFWGWYAASTDSGLWKLSEKYDRID
jgi:hypothetical protein